MAETLEEIKRKTLEQVVLDARTQDGGQIQVAVEYWQAINPRCVMRATIEGKEVVAHEFDFFECLCRIREALEKTKLQLHCYGASKNVFPSGMARDMGTGLQAYKLTLGQKGSMENLVGIFENGEDVTPSSVEEQARFYKQWLTSVTPGVSWIVRLFRKLKHQR